MCGEFTTSDVTSHILLSIIFLSSYSSTVRLPFVMEFLASFYRVRCSFPSLIGKQLSYISNKLQVSITSRQFDLNYMYPSYLLLTSHCCYTAGASSSYGIHFIIKKNNNNLIGQSLCASYRFLVLS